MILRGAVKSCGSCAIIQSDKEEDFIESEPEGTSKKNFEILFKISWIICLCNCSLESGVSYIYCFDPKDYDQKTKAPPM